MSNALEHAPDEACGVLIGVTSHTGIVNVEQLIMLDNIASDRRVNFRLDDEQLARVVGGIASSDREIVGFFHSHPNGDVIPSESDVALASYPDVPQIIVGLRHSPPSVAAWRIAYGAVSRIDITVGDVAPSQAPQGLSDFQKALILVSAALALLLVITSALALLPPAPEIPR
ncbi:MAG: M67 family metallopeptidase [Anaerolineae bacterium]|nr:M67 family metallopeptidase [Anaerolineae bacterium]NUQ02571.1 M67 family metallopeptidase [Anaerolineae bacterium]